MVRRPVRRTLAFVVVGQSPTKSVRAYLAAAAAFGT